MFEKFEKFTSCNISNSRRPIISNFSNQKPGKRDYVEVKQNYAMSTFLKIAWRNIWRNKTRTLLTLSVIFISVFLAILMTSEEDGTYGNVISNVIDMTGHLQIQDKDYQENRSINQGIILDSSFISNLRKTAHVSQVTAHLESFALASNREMTKGVMVIGIVPSEEEAFAKFKQKYLTQTGGKGIYLKDQDDGILIGEKLATFLRISTNDTLVLISQGYHGMTAAGLFPVRGTIRLPSIELESRMIYMGRNAAQKFYGAAGLVTSVLIKADDIGNLKQLRGELAPVIPAGTCIKSWEEIQPGIVQLIAGKVAGGNFVKGIFYMILGFIIFSTMVMMMYERRKEFGIMAAIGMQKIGLSEVVFFEIILISILGTVLGLAGGYALTSWYFIHPIALKGEMATTIEQYGFEPFIYFSKNMEIYYWQPVVVFCLTLVVYLFPFFSIRRLNIIKSIRV
jgi:ABC-type lipoprotein release transport system permease subunit